ncbi:phenylalanine 4-monooxygenase [Hyphococcus sp. DH-69]|uniref:phenylalanine 4-monooxygenase n=1 Tax=Hyphococcus formosus TaxID=3143534 RepID=UPI00398B20C1
MEQNHTQTPKNPFEANTSHVLRGDYEHMRADYTVDQPYDQYTEADQERWRFLYNRQKKLLKRYAAQEYIDGLESLNAGDAIPRVEDANKILGDATGWQLVAVPGLIPDDVFFDHLANCRFPVSWWIRGDDELDYLVEPDYFHDFFGHVPLLSNPVFAEYMRKYGKGGPKAIEHGAQKMLARLYWYIVEFGLIKTPDGLRAFGAGMLSSKDETIYSIESPKPNRIAFDLERVLNTAYMVDDFQKTYFVVDSFESLFEISDCDFTPFYERGAGKEPISPEKILPTDTVINKGQF